MFNTQKVYSMLGNDNLWETAESCHRLLSGSGIPHVVCGGVAVCLHGYQRNTVDLNLIIRSEDSHGVATALTLAGMTWDQELKEFRTAQNIAVQFLISGDKAGKGQQVLLPTPDDPNTTETIDGLPVLRLSKLIEIKLACGLGNLRRTHKDFADVVELIIIHELGTSYARYLHKSVRKEYRELVKRVRADS